MDEKLIVTPLSKHLITSIDKVNETRALTATKLQNFNVQHNLSIVNRPNTHDGKLIPTTPKSKHNKERIGLSPRQISFKLVSDEVVVNTQRAKDNRKLNEAVEASEVVTTINNTQSLDIKNDSSDVIIKPNSTTTTTLSNKETTTTILPSFIKSRSPKAINNKRKKNSDQVPLVLSSAYPSLSHRLNASILYNSTTTQSMSQSFDNPNSNLDDADDDEQQADYHFYTTEDASQSTTASTIFQDMNMDDILSYLLESKQKNSTNAPFVHVASRFNIEYVAKRNFYDLVILDRPGNPKSGLVWTASHYKTDHEKLIPANAIMQLSLYGLLSYSNPLETKSEYKEVQHILAHVPGGINEIKDHSTESAGELVSITQFMLEKSQLEYLRTGRFFGCFKECKAFNAWRYYARHNALVKAKQELLKESFFAEEELVSCMLEISNTIYYIEHNIHLFWYHGNGIICLSDYIEQQIHKNNIIKQKLVQILHELTNKIEFHYYSYINSDKLAKKQQDVKDHHPLKDLIKEDSTVKFRSILLIEDEFKRKLKRICLVAQFNIDLAIAKLIKNFWCHFKQFILGIKHVSRNAYFNEDNYWSLDKSLFTTDDNITTHTLDYYNSIECVLNDKHITKEVLEAIVSINCKNDHKMNLPMSEIIENIPSNHSINTETVVMHIKENYQLKNKIGVRINKAWEQLGSHICINLHLLKDKTILGINDFLTLRSMENLKVITQPTKSEASSLMFALCNDLSHLIEIIPSIKKHKLILENYIPEYHPIPLYEDTGPSSSISNSISTNFANNAYFTTMTMRSIFNTTGGYESAVETLRMVNQAFLEATALDHYVFKLFEIIRSLWTLNPSLLSKRIERSFVLPKMTSYIENPDTVDDLKRSQGRDEGQLHAFEAGTECLHKTAISIQKFHNLKHKLGFVTSFRPIVEQLLIYRSIQNHALYVKLPTSFNNRCSLFYHFIRKLTEFYDKLTDNTNNNQNINDIKDVVIQGLYRLRNFDSIREIFDSEQETCESIYKMIENSKNEKHTYIELNAIELKVKSLFSNSSLSNSSAVPSLTSEKLYNVFIDAISSLLSSSNKARTSLMSCINNLKGETIKDRSNLQKLIIQETKEIEMYDWSTTEKSASEVSFYLSKKKSDVNNIQSAVDKNVSAQFILLEAHDIIGAASPILEPSEVDRLVSIDHLNMTYHTRYKAWNCVLDMTKIEKQILAAKVFKSDIAIWSNEFFTIIKTFYNLKQVISDDKLLTNICKFMEKLAPKIEITSFFSTPSLKSRHWKQLSDQILISCGLNLKFLGKNDENMYLQDITKKEPLSLGNVKNVIIKEFMDRGIEKYLNTIRYITSEAVIEASMEDTLDSVEKCLKELIVHMSGEWLRDSAVREKVQLELNEVINITELNVIIKYCIKSVLMVENSAQDMNTIAFDIRIDKLKVQLHKLDKFITNLDEAQQQWLYLMPFIKFSGRGEIDRDAMHMFNKCTEDLKRIEAALLQRSESLVQAVANSTENDLNTENLKSNLSSILDASHSSIQSLLDACPRLSLISYSRLVSLVELWLFGPQTMISYVSDCFQDMYEGVGELIVSIDIVTRLYHCLGFHSSDNIETIIFEEPILFLLTLDEFVKKFNYQLRAILESSCDLLILNRIKCLQSLLTDSDSSKILDNISNVFQVRVSKLYISFSDKIPNEAFYLINNVSFAEDVWTALGHPTGCIVMARSDLAIETSIFSNHWRISLNEMLNECKRTILSLQDMVVDMKSFPKINIVKSKALLSSLLLQEISFLRVIEVLIACKCLESATELWAGRYQLRFQYNESERHLQAPIDISLGSISIPHGFEYSGGKVRFLCDLNIENVLQKTLGSALSMRGSLFINHEDSERYNSKYESSGESSISMKDLAAGLGRICTTITNLNHPHAVNFYLARILYLDAIGSIDFTNITSNSLQVLINCMNLFWNAIENKNDQFIQDSLKFPLKTKFARSELQTDRRKNNLHELRKNITYMKKTNRFIGMVIIGIASESFYSNISVFDEFYRNIFNAISLVYNKPIDNLGLYLTAVGFKYGMDIQSTLKSSINELKDPLQLLLIQSLFTTVAMKELANLSIKTLQLYILSKIKLPTDNAARFKIELLCFCCTLWEKIISYSNEYSQVDLQLLRNEIFLLFYKKLELIATAEEIISFDQMIGPNELMINKVVTNAINKITNRTGLLISNEFITQCALFWEMISNTNNAVVIIHGEAAIGKTCICNTVINTIKTIGLKSDCFLSVSWPSKCRRSAELILITMKIWIKQLKLNRITLTKKQEQLEKERSFELSNPKNNKDNVDGLVANLNIIQEIKLKINKSNAKRFLKSFKEEEDKYLIHTSIIHHTSLSSHTLLGHFDNKGHWSDGILIRKIRHMDINIKSKTKNNYIQPFHIIILNGPIGYLVEQIFSSPFYLTPSSISLNNLPLSRSLLFPNSEYHKLPAYAKIVIETNNITHASPGCFTFIPMLKVSSLSGDICIKKLINTWIRSIMHWLGNFSPWLDFLEFLQNLLLNRKFVSDLIYMEHFAFDIQAVEVVSKISAFLRYLEDLLKQIHVLVLNDATFSIQEDHIIDNNQSESDSDSDDDDDNSNIDPNKITSKYIVEEALDSKIGLMSLSLKNRELLLKRGYISIIYSAIWGFGGIYNSTERRKFFDSAMRDSIMHYFDEDISISTDCSVFECVLDLRNAELIDAVQIDSKTSQIIMNPGIPKKFESNHIYAEMSIDNNNILFHSPSTRAFKIALEHLLSTGANVLVLGSKSCGKTFIINQMLQDLSKSIVSPLKLRQQINENLVDIVNGVRKTEGIFAALDILQYIVNQFATSSSTNKTDSQIDFTTLWQSAGKQLKSLWRETAKKNFENKNISSSITSVRSTSTASDLRYWLEREFTTEVPFVLETSRFSYGLVFIDDLHLSTMNDHDNESNMRLIENRIESLLKGIMEGTPLFNIQRNINFRNPNKLGYHDGIPMSEYIHEAYDLPILHREFCTDPRFPAVKELDNYVLQRTGVLCAATGQYNDFLKSIYFSQMLPHLSCIGLPTMNSTELHVSLIAGAVVSMNSGTLDQTLIDIFKNEIVELSRVTMNMCSQIISSNDINLTSSLERTIRSVVIIDISLVCRFCISLQYGCNHVTNPGGLLQLYCHEWKRYFLDPLPNGAQRDRIVNLLVEQLDSLDCNQWSISNDWMKVLQYDFVAHKDRVWTDSRIFKSNNILVNKNNILSEERINSNELKMTGSTSPLLKRYNIIFNDEINDDKEKQISSISDNNSDNNNTSLKTNGVYLPVELDHERTELNAYNGSWNPNTLKFNETQEPDVLVGHIDKILDFKHYIDIDIRTVLYPAAISLMLRMIRILSVSGKHLLLTGYFGSTRITALYLAAKVCNLDIIRYDVKQPTGVTEAIPSENTRYSMDFTRFMKDAIYKIAGFKINHEMMNINAAAMLSSSTNQQNSIIYDIVPSQRILIGISSCQQLSQSDRKLLLSIIDYQDASYIFDNNEVLGMMEALQKDRYNFHKNNNTTTINSFETTNENVDGFNNSNNNYNLESSINPNTSSPINTNINNPTIVTTLKHQSIFTAYAFHWIKNHLKDAIIRNLTVAIDVDISRSMKLDTNNNSIDAKVIIKKMTSATSQNHHHSNKQNTTSSSIPNNNDNNYNDSSNMKAKNQRYSLLSKRTPTNKINLVSSDKIFNPNLISTMNNKNETNNSTNYLESTTSTIEPNSIFTCPLLGPMISRSFFTLWYDIESYDAARGICSILMKNEKYYLPSSSSILSSTMKSTIVKPTPTILSLRTSSIGTFILKNEISMISDSNKDDNKKITKAEEQAKFDEEERRKKKFKSSEILDRFNIILDHNTIDFKNIVKFLGVLDNIGVFKSFSSNIILDETQEEVINKYISSFIEEARAILPHVLSVPITGDALFLSEPIVTMGSESIAQIASNLVMYLITELSSYLIRRKFILETVLVSLDGSIEELEKMKLLEEQLLNSNTNLQGTMRKITKETELLRKQMDGFANTFECSIHYENQNMLQEDIYSMKYNSFYIDNYMKLNLKNNRNKISSYVVNEWHDFSSHYTGKNLNKQYIELMRGIMILIKQTVKVSTKSDKSKASKAEDDNIAKFASTLLIKYNDFINLIFNMSANPLSITQLQLLHQVNLNLNSSLNLDLETMDAYKVMKIMKELNIITPHKDPIFESLKLFLLIMELKVITQQTSDNFLNQVNIINPILIELQHNNNISKNNQASDLKTKLDLLLNKMHSIDAILMKNRKKIKALELCITKRDILFQGIEKSKIFVDIELSQINEILKCFIADVSISVAILLRVGWLPEQIRQESIEQLRSSLVKNSVNTSDNPFLLGQLIDRRQINQWSNYDLNSLSLDPASINSMYLLQLVPYFALIIDPDGSAISVLTTNYLENYKTYQISAQKFSFALFESWIQAYQDRHSYNTNNNSSQSNNNNNNNNALVVVGISLLITDLQAGVSEDLICFLSSDILSVNSLNSAEDSSNNFGLEFIINPYSIMNSSNNDSIKKTFRIPCKFRLTMITSKCFSMDEYGSSYPLPISSMKHVTVIHWAEGCNKSYSLDSKPENYIQNKQYITDQTLSQKMGSILCKKLSSYHFYNITSINQKITTSTLSLYNLEDLLVNLMYQCICEEKISSIVYSTEIIVEETIVNIEFIPMYLLTNEHILQKLIEFIPLRINHILDIERSKTNLRDLIAYFQVVTEVFSMSIDFIKTCSTFLPHEILSPYALTSNAICNNFLKPTLLLADQKHFLKGLPRSLKEMKSISKGLSNLQIAYRVHSSKTNKHEHKVTTTSSNSNNNLTKHHSSYKHGILANPSDSYIFSNNNTPNTIATTNTTTTFNTTNTAADRRRSSIRLAKLDWSEQNFGMVHSIREKMMNEISIILIPLKTFFLRELVHYIQLSIRPGLEWLSKFLLLITTWSQSDTTNTIPIDEIRTLIYFVMESAGQNLPRYSYLIQNYSNNNNNNNNNNNDQNTTKYNENSSNEIVKLVTSRPSILRPSISTVIPDQNNLLTPTLSESTNNYSDFLSELPNIGTMQSRITTYRTNQNQDIKNQIHKRIQPSLVWLDRGYGLIDGLMFNSKSSKWLLHHNIPNDLKLLTCSERLFRKQCIMLDMNQSIINRNKNITNKQINIDSFEYEWFKVKGIRIFSKSNNNTSVSLLNEGSSSINSNLINNSKQQIKSPIMKLPTSLKMPKAHSMKATTMIRKSSTKLTLVSELSKLTVDDNDMDENEINKNIITTKNRRLSLVNIDNINENLIINHHKRSLKAAESNTIARTSKNERISKPLTNVTTTLGKHRTSLLLADQTSSVSSSSSRNNSKIQPGKISISHNKSNQNTIIELSQRRITLSQSKRQSALVSDTNTTTTTSSTINNKQQPKKTLIGTSGLQNRFNADGKLIEDISDILNTPLAYKNTLMLETHPQLAKIFKGMSCGIVRNISDFVDWKSALSALKTIDPIKLSAQDLKLLLFTIKPPNFDDYEDEIEQGADVGLWLKGYELTIIQSLLLSEAIVPGSSGSLVEVVFALQASYLQKKGHIIHHSDENISQIDHSDSEDDQDNEEDEDIDDNDDGVEEEDNFNMDAILPSRHSSEVKSNSDSRSTFFRNLDKFSDLSYIRSQNNIHVINSWKILEKVLKGTCRYRGAQCYSTKNTSILTCRDFENWESVLLDVLLEDLGIEKYVFTKDLRDSTMGLKSSIFLTNYLNSIQISILSQRARDIAVHHYDHISVINCKDNTNDNDNDTVALRSRCITDGNIYRNQRIILVDLIKNIKHAINHQRTKRAIVESLDFQSTFGNSIVNSVLIIAMHSITTSTNTTTNNNIAPLSQSQQYFSKLETRKKSILLKLLEGKPSNVLTTKSIETPNVKSWHKSFPLIISSEWGKNVSGIGPLISLSEMNYVWLPRFTPADVLYSYLSSTNTSSSSINPIKNNSNISSSFSSNTSNMYNKHIGIPPSIAESCGLLYEELESSLLWVMNCSKCLNKSRVTDEIRNRLRGVTPVEIRLTACLVTLWQLVQYLRCSKRELHDIPAVWSICLNPISLWQFTRLMLKACDIIEIDWAATTSVKERLNDEKFTKAIWILAESFSNNDCNIYSSGHNNNNNKNEIKEIKKSTNKSTGNAFGLSQTNQSYILQLKQNLNASKITSKIEHNTNNTTTNNTNNTTTNNRNSTIDNGYLSPRAKKHLRRKVRLENEARINYLQALSSSDKFSIYFNKNNLLHSTSISKDNQSNILIEKEFLDQFVSCIGNYISAVIDESQRCKNINQSVVVFDQSTNLLLNNKDHTIINKKNAFDSFSSISLAAMEARRMSNKINIKNFSNYNKINDNNNNNSNAIEFEIWPDITDSMDLIFGTMNSQDIIQSMVTWTFHGHIEKNKNIEGKNIKRSNILKSIKKLSLLIKEGKVDLYQTNVKY